MSYHFSFLPWRQKFTHPVVTHHGIWEIRESIILRLVDGLGRIGWGEISPISWFGSESLAQAGDFCQSLPEQISSEIIFAIPDHLPACQFGFESGLASLSPKPSLRNLTYSGLLSAGTQALSQWKALWEKGYRTFKWKIGVLAIAQELEIFDHLICHLPNSAKLRLDANGGLTPTQAELWLRTCDQIPDKIEFLEQPRLPNLDGCVQQGWRGVFVIKPGIIGSPSRLRQYCQQHNLDLVFSSVFETAIGRQAALQLATELSQHQRAVGFGIDIFSTPTWANFPQNLWNNL
jgi:O-succinylbenzoate synthase